MESIILAYSAEESCHIWRISLLLLSPISHEGIQACFAILCLRALLLEWLLARFVFFIGANLVVFERREFIFVFSQAGFGRIGVFLSLFDFSTTNGMTPAIDVAKSLILVGNVLFRSRDSVFCSSDFHLDRPLFSL